MEINPDYFQLTVKDDKIGSINITYATSTSISLGYPCNGNIHKCTPYVLEVEKGNYLFECWGSKGEFWYDYTNPDNTTSTPGYGAYTSGILSVTQKTTFYVYIGITGFFNAVEGPNTEQYMNGTNPCSKPGGATDVRLNSSDNWWDKQSLISRIMVAAGGGGSEWQASVGGNGGGIEGGESKSANETFGINNTFKGKCSGANQTSGSTNCPSYTALGFTAEPATGSFGKAGIPNPRENVDYGGFGGGGYYGGTSYGFAFAGSGGSSYISGHPGCKSVENSTDIKPTDSPYHYSGLIFQNTRMISGAQTMPLPSNMQRDFYDGEGAFRITVLFQHTRETNNGFYYLPLSYVFMMIYRHQS